MNVNAAVNWILLTIATFPKISPPVMSINRMVPISPKDGLRLAKAASRGALAADTSAPESMKAVAGLACHLEIDHLQRPNGPRVPKPPSLSPPPAPLQFVPGVLISPA